MRARGTTRSLSITSIGPVQPLVRIKMLKAIILAAFCCILVAAAPAADEKPEPYAFNFDSTDEFGTKIARQESGDAQGVVQGQYSYQDANGLTRTVSYIADDDGFRATVNSNEPGLISSAPAAATYNVQ